MDLRSIPGEICLDVLSFLAIKDVVAVSQPCKYFFNLTKDKSLWLSFLYEQHSTVPLLHSVRDLLRTRSILALDQPSIRDIVTLIHRTQHDWLLPRHTLWPDLRRLSDPSSKLHLPEPRVLFSLDVVLDRWLVVVASGAVEIWDLLPYLPHHPLDGAKSSWHRVNEHPVLFGLIPITVGGNIIASAMSLDSLQDAIHISVIVSKSLSRDDDEAEYVLVYKFPFTAHDQGTVYSLPLRTAEVVHNVRRPAHRPLKAYNPSSDVMAFSASQTLILANLETDVVWEITVGYEGEEFWSTVVGVRFITPRHILCVKTRSVELYTFAESFRSSLELGAGIREVRRVQLPASHICRQEFPVEISCRGVSFSEHRVSEEDSMTTITCDFLAVDVLRGLFHHRVTTLFPPAFLAQQASYSKPDYPNNPTSRLNDVTPPLSMDVTLVTVHHMAQSIPRGLDRASTPTPRSGFTPGSRGFVSTCAFGAQGMRGVWVERERNSVKRSVYGFEVDRLGDDGREVCEARRPGMLEGKCIYSVVTYDLRDDITHCAFSEATGKVILGTRNGELVLP